MTRVNGVQEWVSDIEDKLMAMKEAEEKKRKTIKRPWRQIKGNKRTKWDQLYLYNERI